MSHHVGGDQRAAAAHYQRCVELFTKTDDRRALANTLSVLALCGPSFHSSSTTPFSTPAGEEEVRALPARRLSCLARRIRSRSSNGSRSARGSRRAGPPAVDRGVASLARRDGARPSRARGRARTPGGRARDRATARLEGLG